MILVFISVIKMFSLGRLVGRNYIKVIIQQWMRRIALISAPTTICATKTKIGYKNDVLTHSGGGVGEGEELI